MVNKHPQANGPSIHITGGARRQSNVRVKRDRRTADASDTPTRSQSKRSKRAKHSKERHQTLNDSLTTSENKFPRAWDAPSLRHLFSFASEAPANPSSNPGLSQGFAPGVKKESVKLEKPITDQKSGTHLHAHNRFSNLRGEEEQVSGSKGAEFDSAAERSTSQAANHSSALQAYDTDADPGLIPTGNIERFEKDGEVSPSHLVSKNFTHYDLYDDETIANAAAKFCRTVAIDDICAEFERKGGIREMMKSDFKLKRHNALRGRKLGTASST